MNALPTESPAWSPTRRGLLILLVFVAHLGLISALSDRRPLSLRPPAPAPVLELAPAEHELLALSDPTLFALPHRRSFSGEAWLRPTIFQVAPFRWTEPVRLLPLQTETLGAVFRDFMQTNVFASLAFETKPAPAFEPPRALAFGAPPRTNSILLITGSLAERRLLNPPQLPAFPAPDLLTNTVAQVLVRPDGLVFSATLLTSSTSKDADQRALEIARTARFEAVAQPPTALISGQLIFKWHTEPQVAEAKPTP